MRTQLWQPRSFSRWLSGRTRTATCVARGQLRIKIRENERAATAETERTLMLSSSILNPRCAMDNGGLENE